MNQQTKNTKTKNLCDSIKICKKTHKHNRRIKEHEDPCLVNTSITIRTDTIIITNRKIKQLKKKYNYRNK